MIGFITPLHHSAALPFAMVDEPLRPLKHGRLRDWGWGRGGMEGGWRKARRLRSLLLHLLPASSYVFPHTSLAAAEGHSLRPPVPHSNPLPLPLHLCHSPLIKVSERTAILYSAASKEAERGGENSIFGGDRHWEVGT